MRLDVYLVFGGYVESRTRAKSLIESGAVLVDGKKVLRGSMEIDEVVPPQIEITKTQKYVSRGGLKLEAALERFDIDVSGLCAIDIGASTGGFTDCLLQRGIAKVYAVDSGEGQLAPSIAKHPCVVNMEKYNARNLLKEDFESKIDLAVMDVSFISQTLILPSLSLLLPEGGLLVSLIKPQFEAGRSAVGKKGIVKRMADRHAAILRVVESAATNRLICYGMDVSPVFGGDGNVEFIAVFRKGGEQGLDSAAFARIAQKEPIRREKQ